MDRSGAIDEHSGGGRGVERLHRPEVLTADAHAFPARGQDIDAGCVLHDSLDEPTYGPGEVLAVVEDEEETTAGQLGDDLVGDPAERPFAYTDGGGDGTIDVGGPSERTQIAESDAVPVAVPDVRGRFEREPGLADPAGTAQRHDSRLAERARHRRHIAIAPQETVGRSGQCAVRGNNAVLQDALFELTELRRRFEAPLDELAPPALVHRERVGVASRLVQRLHQELAGVLALGMLDDQCLKVGDDLVVFPACQLRLRVAFASDEAEFLEPYGLSAGELALGELHERWPTPEGQRLIKTAVGEKTLEEAGVDLVGLDVQPVSVLFGEESVRTAAQSPAQPRDLRPESRRRIGREAVGPELIDQAIGGDGAPGVGEQHREEQPLLGTRNADQLVTVGDFERTEDAVPQHVNTIGR